MAYFLQLVFAGVAVGCIYALIGLGFAIIFKASGVILRWGSNPVPPGTPFQITSGFNFGGVHFGANDVWTIIVTVILCAALFYFFRFTKYGLAMRATALDQEAALAIGINIRTVYALAWGIAAAIATIGGVFLAAKSIAFDTTLGSTALL